MQTERFVSGFLQNDKDAVKYRLKDSAPCLSFLRDSTIVLEMQTERFVSGFLQNNKDAVKYGLKDENRELPRFI